MFKCVMTSIISILLIISVILFILIRFLEGTSVFFPSKTIEMTPANVGVPFEDLYLTTSDGAVINAWLAKSSSGAATVIFAHGNAGSMSERVMKVKFLHDLGLNVLMFDYRGYGRSQGHPTEKGVYLDAQKAYDYLLERGDIDHKRIIGYGASLGGAVMIDLATKRKLSALIVESSFTSAAQMGKRLYPILPTFLMSIKFDSLSKIGKIDAPKFFIHSPADRVVPFSMGQKLYETAKGPKGFLTIYGGHNDAVMVSDPKLREAFKQFLQRYSLL